MADPNQGYQLNEQSIRRIQRALTRVENQPYDLTSKSRPVYRNTPAINWQFGKNASGGTIPAWSCVAIGTVTGTSDGFVASLTQPAGTAGAQYGLTGPQDSPSTGPSGSQSLCGFHVEAGWATYDTGTPAVGEPWGPKSGQFTLSKGLPGYQIVAVIDSSRKLVLVTRVIHAVLLGKADSNISKGSSGTVSIYTGASGSETDSGANVTASALGGAITSGKWVTVEYINGVPYVFCWEA